MPYLWQMQARGTFAHTRTMIISASYRTDIPAFYAEWFRRRFAAGHARVVNPYGGQSARVPLRDGVDGFVFWTRNIGPFLPALADLRHAGLPFVVQYTVTAYPRTLEASVIAAERSVALIARVAADYGPRAVVWRFDPIVFSSQTQAGFHRDAFARLAAALAGSVDEVVISFATVYAKTARNLNAAAADHGFTWSDPADEDKRLLATELAALAAAAGLKLTMCSQPGFVVPGTAGAACVDAGRLEDVAAGWGLARKLAAKRKGNRPGCLCHESRDIGAYDSCPHGCVYCYAVRSPALAKRRFRRHDPASEFLFPPADAAEAPA